MSNLCSLPESCLTRIANGSSPGSPFQVTEALDQYIDGKKTDTQNSDRACHKPSTAQLAEWTTVWISRGLDRPVAHLLRTALGSIVCAFDLRTAWILWALRVLCII